MAAGLAALLRALAVWVLFIVAESAQGALRRSLLAAQTQLAAKEVGVLIGAGIIFALTWAGWRWLGVRRGSAALAVGGLWTSLTVAFDVGLGRWLGSSWSAVASDYDPRQGGFLLLGLAAMTVTPWIVWRLRGPVHPVDTPQGGLPRNAVK